MRRRSVRSGIDRGSTAVGPLAPGAAHPPFDQTLRYFASMTPFIYAGSYCEHAP